ncbi:N-formylglutamate amidohydrolase (plasmid) [Rhodococcus globerulus]|uniref:N-formylglutamate amidohydrolase n=1 Tax=Rhodococcus globerulus TaxID=33008 RepID=UPI0039EA40B6
MNSANSADAERHAHLHNSVPDDRVAAFRQDDRSENTSGRSVPDAFTVIPGDEGSPVVIHVPHSSRLIPPDIRADLMLTDQELADELDEATDTATDEIALAALAHVRVRPTIVINHLSRLVIDPERFPDGDPAEAFGRGAVYTRTCSGAPLRAEPYPRRAELLEAYFRPYADAVTDAVADRLNVCGRAIVIDLHSYPEKPSAFEDSSAARPPLCIGTDPVHSPGWLIAAARGAFTSLGEIRENTPYSGTYVPLRYYGQGDRVSSVMIEVRRDTYLTVPVAPHPARIAQLGRNLAALIDAVSDRAADV